MILFPWAWFWLTFKVVSARPGRPLTGKIIEAWVKPGRDFVPMMFSLFLLHLKMLPSVTSSIITTIATRPILGMLIPHRPLMCPGVFFLQENLKYSPALYIICQILPQILPQLQSLQVSPNQINLLTLFCDHHVTVPNACLRAWGCLRGDMPPSEAGKFCIFEIGFVQFGEYFWVQI